MKTLTEFSGFVLQEAFKKIDELQPRPKREPQKDRNRFFRKKGPKNQSSEELKIQSNDQTPNESQSVADKQSATDNQKEQNQAEQNQEKQTEQNQAQQQLEGQAINQEQGEQKEQQAENTQAPQPPQPQIDFKPIFAEQFKLDGEKLDFFMNAVELTKTKRRHLKRVVVLTLNEGEKPPVGAIEKDGKWYIVEYFYVPKPPKKKFRGKKNKKRFGKNKNKKKFFNKKKRFNHKNRSTNQNQNDKQNSSVKKEETTGTQG
jgi:hypothetical protein